MSKVKLEPWIVLNHNKKPNSCIICLPGRGSHAGELVRIYNNELSMDDNLIVGITPRLRFWYPLPNGANDQQNAVNGIDQARQTIEYVIEKITSKTKIPHNRIFIVGYSAGAVIAIQTAIYSYQPLAGIIAHSGAILEPESIPSCQHSTKYFLTHSKDDVVFKWRERYLPMLNALKNNGYDVQTLELNYGDHFVQNIQFLNARNFIYKVLNEN